MASARGYIGNGVATANLAGRVLADLITGAESDITALPCVNHRSPQLGAGAVPLPRRALRPARLWRIDQKAERTGIPPSGKTLAERLTRH